MPKSALFKRQDFCIHGGEPSVSLENFSPFLPFPYNNDVRHKKPVSSLSVCTGDEVSSHVLLLQFL